VDEAELRAAQGADFAGDVPESAREGTRHNMARARGSQRRRLSAHHAQNAPASSPPAVGLSRICRSRFATSFRSHRAGELYAQRKRAACRWRVVTAAERLGLRPSRRFSGRSPCRMRCTCSFTSSRAPNRRAPRALEGLSELFVQQQQRRALGCGEQRVGLRTQTPRRLQPRADASSRSFAIAAASGHR